MKFFIVLLLLMPMTCVSQDKCDSLTAKGLTLFHEEKNMASAIIKFTESINLCPNNWVAFNSRGSVRLQMKDYEGARGDFRKAIDLNHDGSSYYGLATCLQILGHKEAACLYYRKAFESGVSEAKEAMTKACNKK